MDNAQVKEVLAQIEETTDYIFLYQSGTINLDRRVNVNVTNEPLSTVLDKIFKDTGVTWSVKNRQISLKQGEVPAVQTSSSKNKRGKHTLTGVVTDATDAEPLIGASVVIK